MSFLSVSPKSLMQHVKKMKVCITELIHTISIPPPTPRQIVLTVKPGIKYTSNVKAYTFSSCNQSYNSDLSPLLYNFSPLLYNFIKAFENRIKCALISQLADFKMGS